MQPLMRLARRVTYWFRFRAQQADLRDELAFHHEQLANDLERRGLSPDAARVAARREMGNETYMREEARGVWLSSSLDGVAQDCRYAWRSLRRSPAFTAIVVITLALGIGANTAIFSVVHHLLLAPLPFADGNRIVMLQLVSPAGGPHDSFGVGANMVRSWEERSRTLAEFSLEGRRRYRLGDAASQDTVSGASVSPSFLPLLRVHPALGRGFVEGDTRRGASPTVVIGYGLWQRLYGGAPDVIGKVVKVNDLSRTVIGVAPNEAGIPISDGTKPDIWLPLSPDSVDGNMEAFARLRPGVTADAASRELQSIGKATPDTGILKGWRPRAVRAQDMVDPNVTHAIDVLFVAAGGLLLIACANIANLLLMRAWTRQRELVIRRALGASRMRIARHVLTESLMLAVMGGGLGLLVAWRGLHAVVALRPDGLSDLEGVHVDMAVLLWTTVIAVTSGLLFGVAPALFSGGDSMGDALRAGVRSAVGSSAGSRLRGGMVAAEVALSFIFLVAAGLLVRSFVALEGTSIGYDRAGLVAVNVHFTHPPARADGDVVHQTLMRAITAIPGVAQAALGRFPGGLLMTDVLGGPFAIEGPNGPETIDLPFCEAPYIGPGYFRVTRVPLLRGRGFDASDPAGAVRELVVNQALARRLWPNGNALGAKLRVGHGASETWLTVVGVAGDVHLPGTHGDLFNLQMYRPVSVAPAFMSGVVLRLGAGASMATLEPMLKRAVESIGFSATLQSADPAESVYDRRILARPRFALILFGLFAVFALAVVGGRTLRDRRLRGHAAHARDRRTRRTRRRACERRTSHTRRQRAPGRRRRFARSRRRVCGNADVDVASQRHEPDGSGRLRQLEPAAVCGCAHRVARSDATSAAHRPDGRSPVGLAARLPSPTELRASPRPRRKRDSRADVWRSAAKIAYSVWLESPQRLWCPCRQKRTLWMARASGRPCRRSRTATQNIERWPDDALPLVIWTCDTQGLLEWVNDRWLELTGLTREETLTAKGALVAVHPDDRLELARRWGQALESATSCEVEYRIRNARWRVSVASRARQNPCETRTDASRAGSPRRSTFRTGLKSKRPSAHPSGASKRSFISVRRRRPSRVFPTARISTSTTPFSR